MNSSATCSPKISALATAAVLTAILFAASANAQQLQRGISVEMATARNASPMPAADEDDAWVVAVTADGSIYFGTDKMSGPELTDTIRTMPHKRDQHLFIKADARATFASLKPVLGAARDCYFKTPVLLTSQPVPAPPGTIVPAKGFEVMVVPQADQTLVQLSNDGKTPDGKMSLWIDGKPAPWPDFEGTLNTALQKRGSKLIQIEPGDSVPFAAIVRVIDAAKANGASVALPAFHAL
jgi:biopolymer transport protein ExbD